jgi:hypothetical protein
LLCFLLFNTDGLIAVGRPRQAFSTLHAAVQSGDESPHSKTFLLDAAQKKWDASSVPHKFRPTKRLLGNPLLAMR